MAETLKPDYRDTVFLPRTDFPMRGSLPQKEPELLARWRMLELYQRLRKNAHGKKLFVLHDGPPYANGNIHMGTALNKVLKDVINRTYQMLGYDAPYVPGWDCHGLPIEWKIEEQYRAQSKDKDAVPILQFRNECREFAERWKAIQSEEFQRLGVIGDWEHPYSTMTKAAESQIVREIHKFALNGLLYKGSKPVMWSVVEKTALAEAEVEYKDHTSTTLLVRFPVLKTPHPLAESASVVIWTTTPWTLPANRAIAFGDFAYAILEVKTCAEGSLAQPGERLLLALDRVNRFCEETKIVEHRLLAEVSGKTLEGTLCAHPFRKRPGSEGYFDFDVPLYFGDFVTTDAGTGFVHIAPGHGEDDFRLGLHHHIKFDEAVGDDGRYLETIKGFAGLYVYKPDGKVGEANGAVIKALLEQNRLLGKQNIKHSYPHSWRSKAPVIFRTTPQWFIAMDRAAKGAPSTLRESALAAIRETTWVPEIGENRIRGMIESRPDWCISRQRAWGVPIALFVHKKSGEVLKDPAVFERIAVSFKEKGADAWYAERPETFLGPAYAVADYIQIFDIVDVWFESGSTHAFCLNQNLGSSEWPNLSWPASLYLEGSDQHRGWFHSSLLEACGTMGRAPFAAVLTHGFVLDEQGRKMSKSLNNTVAPQEIIKTHGADILRLWALTADYTEDLRIGPDIIKQTSEMYRRFRNTLRYLLGALDGLTEEERVIHTPLPELEQWLLHRLTVVDLRLRTAIAEYNFGALLVLLHDFCNSDLSAFYFDIRKDSLYCDRHDSDTRLAARSVMKVVFDHLVVWLAPILCFTAEEAYLAHGTTDKKESVHLEEFKEIPLTYSRNELAQKWEKIRQMRRVITGALEKARTEKRIGSSLQAHPIVYVSEAIKKELGHVAWETIVISSSLTLIVAESPSEAYRLAEVPDVAVIVEIAQGEKCERCWQILPEVSKPKSHPSVCLRCDDAISFMREKAA